MSPTNATTGVIRRLGPLAQKCADRLAEIPVRAETFGTVRKSREPRGAAGAIREAVAALMRPRLCLSRHDKYSAQMAGDNAGHA